MSLKLLAWMAGAGALGTLCRFGLSAWIQNLSPGRFPLGTLAVNILGCFLFGLVFILAEERQLIPGAVKVVVLAGFMGAFTTFSTFGFETAALVHAGEWSRAVLNVLAQNIAGILAVSAGILLARAF